MGKPATEFSEEELRNIFEGGRKGDPLTEMQELLQVIAPDSHKDFIEKLHSDITKIFAGEIQGFRESDTKYHDLRHTRNVALATIRLFHGLHCDSVYLPQDTIRLGLLCAYFHDTGMLLTVKDPGQTGASYLKCHEERSIAFARQYMRSEGYPTAYIDNCESIINCTNLTTTPQDANFESSEIARTGYVLGTADILAQMADRYYLESLPLLYMEQQDAGIRQHSSSIALMRRTTAFYHEVIEKRLEDVFKGIYHAMRSHFREWSQLDENLYMVFIEKNIKYLENVVRSYDLGQRDMNLYLRRRQPKFR